MITNKKSKNIYVGKAPARLDVMGGISDYSGALVLQMPLDLYTQVSLTERTDNLVNIQSGNLNCQIDCTQILKDRGQIVEHKSWKNYPLENWSLYILGCIFILLDKKEFEFKGLDIVVESEIPFGKGVSSSAALEVATMHALCNCFNLEIEKENLALMAQEAENNVAGAPCGIMDQMAVHLGRKNALLPIICQAHQVNAPIPIPDGIQFIGLDTGVKHAVSGSAYSKVRTAAFMGLSIILQSLGISQKEIQLFKEKKMKNIPFGGYLANISVALFEKDFAKLLPKEISGAAFISTFGTTTDPLSSIDPNTNYSVFDCSKHPIFENERIQFFSKLLIQKPLNKKKLGQLMLASHQGYVDCGLSCKEADFIINLVKEKISENQKIYGARITGGGSGGTVCILCEDIKVVKEIQSIYQKEFPHDTFIFEGSADGAYYY